MWTLHSVTRNFSDGEICPTTTFVRIQVPQICDICPTQTNIISLSVADSQASWRVRISCRLVLNIINQFTKRWSTHSVELRWVPGHKDIQGNELADELYIARLGCSACPIWVWPEGPDPFMIISLPEECHHSYKYLSGVHWLTCQCKSCLYMHI